MIEFGTGGWRAIIGEDFTKANIQLLTTAVMRKLKADGLADKGFLIGYDRRFLSEIAAVWAAEVVAGENVHCRLIQQESPTPLIMYAVGKYRLPYGMAITASHNPYIYNGVKLFMEGGRDADEELTADIERHLADILPENIKTLGCEQALASGKIEIVNPMNDYLDTIMSNINTAAIQKAGLKVALDPMYGVSRIALQTILMSSRCYVDTIHERRDVLFGGRLPAPSEQTLTTLMMHVEENNCDIGLATDGDADRLGVVDDEANFLHPNKILALLYYYLLKHKGWQGAAVRNIATTHMLDAIAASFNQQCYEVPVGFKYVSSKMIETGAIIGGESSGGLTVSGHILGKDGIYAAALLVEMLAVTGRKLSLLWQDLVQQYGHYEMVEADYRFSQEKKQSIFALLFTQKSLPSFEEEIDHVSYADGCKVYFKNNGWVIARFSGTEPLLRIFCEMPTMRQASDIAMQMEEFLGLS